jgi:cytoskeletal protein RodZ
LIYKTIEEEKVMKEYDVLSEITDLEVPNGRSKVQNKKRKTKRKECNHWYKKSMSWKYIRMRKCFH